MGPTFLLDSIFGLPIDVTRRKVIVVVVDVTRSNPNGGVPDGAPRQDIHGHGWISNQCFKRGPRDMAKEVFGQEIFYGRDVDVGALRESFNTIITGKGKGAKKEADMTALLKRWDLRVWGGALAVKGCAQFTDLVSVEPVEVIDVGFTTVSHITRTLAPRKGDVLAEAKAKGEDNATAEGELDTDPDAPETYKGGNMQSYKIVDHGVYVGTGELDTVVAQRNGLTPNDLAILYGGIIECWPRQRSAHRTGVNLRRLYVFDIPNGRGVEPAHVTRARVKVTYKAERMGAPSQRWEDYDITVNDDLPPGMQLYRWEDGVVSVSATSIAAK